MTELPIVHRDARSVLLPPFVVLALVASVGLAGCGTGTGDSAELASVRPEDVPSGIVPGRVAGDALAFRPNESKSTVEAFANAGDLSLVADGELWELRKGDRLVGALQLSTLVPRVDLRQAGHRDSIVRQIMGSSPERFHIGDVTVWSSTSNDKAVFLWFGRQMFSVLSLKGDELDTEAITAEVVKFQSANPNWEPLPGELG